MNRSPAGSTRLFAAVALPLLLVLSGCGMSITFGEDIQASGDLVTETFQVAQFDALSVQDTFDIYVTVGESSSVQVLTKDDLVEYLDIRVRNGELKVGLRDGVSVRNETLEATITVPDLASVELSGATSAEIEGLDRLDFSVTVSGASDLIVEGRSTSVQVEASGASNVELQLEGVSETRVDLSGATSLELLSTDQVTGEMSGASDLLLPGEADLDIKTSGSSTITGR